jgi:hypothetical protein
MEFLFVIGWDEMRMRMLLFKDDGIQMSLK